MKNGRRRAKMIFDLLGIIGCLLSSIDYYVVMIIGKIIFGLAIGAQITLTPKIIEETIPA